MATMVRPIAPVRQTRHISLKDALYSLGIKVIPPAKVVRHKKWYQLKAALVSLEFLGAAACIMLCTLAVCACVWAMLKVPHDFLGINLDGLLVVGALGFAFFAAATIACTYRQISTSRWNLSRVSASELEKYRAPATVIEDAHLIKSALPDARLTLETFQLDPVLWVCRGSGDTYERWCIAYWE